jgi:RNA polymerase sigma-70 factor (ECF subfamily)
MIVHLPASRATPLPVADDREARVRFLIEEHLKFVTRVLRKAGVLPSDIDDEVQRTFITVARRLGDVEAGAERGFLFQVALNTAAHARRRLGRRREVLPSDGPPEQIESTATPEYLTERRQMGKLLEGVLASIPEPLRFVFTLSTFDGMKLTEIAAMLRIPRGTVASRLRRARAHLRRQETTIGLAWDMGIESTGRDSEPEILLRQRSSRIVDALLGAGRSTPRSVARRARTLRALGLTHSR